MSVPFDYPASVHNEVSRLQALHALGILDTGPERVFDEAAQLAASICGTPIGLVNLLDADRQWFKARVGIEASEMPREDSFCDHTIGRSTLLVVPDLSADSRFSANPYVAADPNMRFYAGMPLNTAEGHTVGTLCVADTVPHQLTDAQMEALTALGRQVSAQLELRAKVHLLAEVLAQKDRMERELRERSLLFSAFMDHTPATAYIKDREGRFLYYNRLFCERFAISPTEWIGKNVFDIFPEEFASAYHDLDRAVLDSGQSEIVEEASPGPHGTTLHWRTHKFRISNGADEPVLGGISVDTSFEHEAALKLQRSHDQLETANQQLTELSRTDGLTGLRNRRAFDERLASELTGNTLVSLILLDLDCFKNLNDTYGHSVGDDVLRITAGLLQQHSRTSDCVARFGGEEFAILVRMEEKGALAIAERLRAAIGGFAWRQGSVTISAGVATRSAALDSPARLIEAADSALYLAKRNGRNRVEQANAADSYGVSARSVAVKMHGNLELTEYVLSDVDAA